VNKKCLESLVQAGAFDSLGGHRAQYFENIERATAFGQSFQSQKAFGQEGLFDGFGPNRLRAIAYPALIDVSPWSEQEKLVREKAVLGFYVSGHPLMKYQMEINEFANVRMGDLQGFRTGSTAKACGVITSLRKRIDKRGNTMAFLGLEDFSGKAECIVFSDPFAKYQPLLIPDAMVMVIGRGEVNGDALKIVVHEVHPMERVKQTFAKSVILSIRAEDVKENTIVQLRELFERHPGTCPCYFTVVHSTASRTFHARKFAVEASDGFLEQVRTVLGPESVRISG
jgi:DNA polymerase-3 subunit alpha